MSKAMWGGRFSKSTDEMINEFQASINFDKRMYHEDIAGSIAHATMLAKCGIISEEDRDKIIAGLKDILKQIEEGNFKFSVDLEDIHMNIEKRLTDAIGEAGGRLHTARSRNDQVALDTHMYIRREVVAVQKEIENLQRALVETAEKYSDVIMPGYTHLQRAQPILFSHHLLAYFCMLSRDFARFEGVYKRADIMPLGAGALAGTTFPIDREFVQKQLNFENIYTNSMDAVSDRDYIMEFLAAASILMVHLSRLSEETILWCSREFHFVELDDAHCTGSSMMPQKKNPDVSELVRGKTGRVIGHLMAMLTTVKGLPLAYNKDLQEDKEGALDSAHTLVQCLEVMAGMVGTMHVNADRMRAACRVGHLAATDVADYLAKKGMPFREAHAVVGHLVLECDKRGCQLDELPIEEFRAASPLFGNDITGALDIDGIVAARTTEGGTAPSAVAEQLKFVRTSLVGDEARVEGLGHVVPMGAGA